VDQDVSQSIAPKAETTMWMLFVKLLSPAEWWLEPKAKLHDNEVNQPSTSLPSPRFVDQGH